MGVKEIAYKRYSEVGCRCHDVHTGVCVGQASKESKCALDESECELGQEYYTAEAIENSELALSKDIPDCRLCPFNEETMTIIEHWEAVNNKSEFFTGEIVGLI